MKAISKNKLNLLIASIHYNSSCPCPKCDCTCPATCKKCDMCSKCCQCSES